MPLMKEPVQAPLDLLSGAALRSHMSTGDLMFAQRSKTAVSEAAAFVSLRQDGLAHCSAAEATCQTYHPAIIPRTPEDRRHFLSRLRLFSPYKG